MMTIRRNSTLEPRRWMLTAAMLLAAAQSHCGLAQSDESVAAAPHLPAYDVISVKPSKSNSNGTDMDIHDGIFEAKNVSIKLLILNAYWLKDAQVQGLPPWARTSRFDVTAKVTEPDRKAFEAMTDAQGRAMLEPILAERFHLKFHRETKDLPVYELVVARGGPKFKASELKQGDGKTVHGLGAGTISAHNRELHAAAISLDTLAGQLSFSAQRIVINKTDLAGDYDFELKYSADDGPPVDAEAPPSLFTALQEQLGLRLQPARAPVETFVVDHVEMPVED